MRVEADDFGRAEREHATGEIDRAGELGGVKLGFRRTATAAFQVRVPAAAEQSVEDHARETVVEPERPAAAARCGGKFHADEAAVFGKQGPPRAVVGGGQREQRVIVFPHGGA